MEKGTGGRRAVHLPDPARVVDSATYEPGKLRIDNTPSSATIRDVLGYSGPTRRTADGDGSFSTMDDSLRHGEEHLLPTAEDSRVLREIAHALRVAGCLSSRRVDVSASNGVVRLRGRVRSYYQKQVAQAAALVVIGARRLVNEVEVE